MFRARKVCPILTFTILVFLYSGASPSFPFGYGGIHWDASDLPVTWEINQDGTADTTGEFEALRAGYQTWENVSGSYFSETYLGTTSRGLSYDGHNVVSWGNTDGSIATLYYWYIPSTGALVEFDMVFENDYPWSCTGEAGKMDVQNIGTHEFGHTLLLLDLYGSGDTEKTMYGYGDYGETKKRTLHQDDIDGIRYIYPESGNQPPNTPAAPTGPDSGIPNTSYSFSATTTDADGDQVAFKFDWGDGTESAWTSYVNSGSSASKSHSWSTQDTFSVKVKAKDTYGAESGWSTPHQIVTGQAPYTPAAPSGPDTGSPNTSYSFSATTIDPDGDQVAFKFDWGDGNQSAWTSYVNSGSSASKSHSWSEEGTYSVKVKAKDTYSAESGWSAAHSMTIRMILLEIDLSLLDFAEVGQGSAKSMTLRVYNAGSGTLSGTITTSESWITVSPSSFVGNDNLITVTIDTQGLTESLTPYIGVITITSNGGSKSIEIWLVVIPTGVVAYPNPFSFARHSGLTFWGAGVAYARLQIFTLKGELLVTLEENSGASTVLWDGRNEQGNRIARGIYIYLMEDFSGKIVIVE